MRCSIVATAVISHLLLAPLDARAQETRLVDRIVAVVDGEVITLGQLNRAINRARTDLRVDTTICGPQTSVEPARAATETDSARAFLECMIDDLLAFQHVRRFPQFDVLQADVDAEYQRIARQYDSREAFEEALDQQGLTPAEVRYELKRVALVGNYVRVRYRDVIDIRETEARRYYEEVLRAEMERVGAEMPTFEAVDESIEAILESAEFNRRLANWIADLRRRADIVVYLW